MAIIVGITAGYVGGMTDELLSTITNIFLVIPVLPLEIVLSGYLTNAGWLRDHAHHLAHRLAVGS